MKIPERYLSYIHHYLHLAPLDSQEDYQVMKNENSHQLQAFRILIGHTQDGELEWGTTTKTDGFKYKKKVTQVSEMS